MKLGMTPLRQDFSVRKAENQSQKQKLNFGTEIPGWLDRTIEIASLGDPVAQVNLRYHTLKDLDTIQEFKSAPTIPQKAGVVGHWVKSQFGSDDDDDFTSGGGGGPKDERIRQLGIAPATVPVRRR